MKRISITQGPCEWGAPIPRAEHAARMTVYREAVAELVGEAYPGFALDHDTSQLAGSLTSVDVTSDGDDAALMAQHVFELTQRAWQRACEATVA